MNLGADLFSLSHPRAHKYAKPLPKAASWKMAEELLVAVLTYLSLLPFAYFPARLPSDLVRQSARATASQARTVEAGASAGPTCSSIPTASLRPQALFSRRGMLLTDLKPPQIQLISCAKCGSTALYHALCSSSKDIDCRAAKTKEINFFRKNHLENHHSSPTELYEAYVRTGFNFSPKEISDNTWERKVTLDASIWYYRGESPARSIKATLPCSKILWIFRNPLPRAKSLFYHNHGASAPRSLRAPGGKRIFTLGDLLEPELDTILACNAEVGVSNTEGFESPFLACLKARNPVLKTYRGSLRADYLRFALYHFYVQGWRKYFSDSAMFFIDYEDINARGKTTAASVLDFLRLPHSDNALEGSSGPSQKLREVHHQGVNTRKLQRKSPRLGYVAPATLAKLEPALRPHVEALHDLVGRDYNWNLTE
eukprot:jgi/Tetstr1/447059/TSEL_034497.t2